MNILRWIKSSPIPLPFLTVVTIAVFYLIHSFSLLTLSIFFFFLYRLLKGYGRDHLFFMVSFLVLIFLFLGGQKCWNDWQSLEEAPLLTRVRPQLDSLEIKDRLLTFQSGSYRLSYRLKNEEEIEYFKHLDAPVELEIRSQLELAPQARNFGGFDYRDYLKHEGIYYLVRIQQIRSIRSVGYSNPWDFLVGLRRKALLQIDRVFPEPIKHYASGLLFGYLGKDFDQIGSHYRKLGIFHLFALSGMQVSFFLQLFGRLMTRLGLVKESQKKCELVFSFAYYVLTGSTVSVLRSLVQNQLGKWGWSGLDNVALTCLLLFLFRPFYLLSVGGVLSCFYAFAICMLSDKKLWQATCFLVIWVLPILIFYFGEYPLAAVALTYLFSFLFDSFFLPLLLGLFSLSFLCFIKEANWIFQGLEGLIAWLSQHVPAPLVLGKPSMVLLLLFLLLAFLLADVWSKRGWRLTMLTVLTIILILSKFPLENEVTFLDMGQGSSILLRDWKGQTILLDSGLDRPARKDQKAEPASSIESQLLPYLKSRGIDHIDHCILLHEPPLASMTHLHSLVKINHIYSIEPIEFQGRESQSLTEGRFWSIMDGRLQVVQARDGQVSLHGRFLGTSFLFMGAKEKSDPKSILNLQELGSVDVLSMRLSGEEIDLSEPLIRDFTPARVVLTAHKKGRQIWPREDSLEILERWGSEGYRLDRSGALRYRGLFSWKLESQSDFWYNGSKNKGDEE